MGKLRSLRKYFFRYRGRLLLGVFFITLSNLFAVLSPVIFRRTVDSVIESIRSFRMLDGSTISPLMQSHIFAFAFRNALLMLVFAVLCGLFMFFMRQTIIVMSRHIEFDQKNEIFQHYQALDTQFYKMHFTGDLMNRISEDVARVRMFTGPSVMYAINLLVRIAMCTWGMLAVDPLLTLYVLAPLPFLALSIYLVNRVIARKSERIQAQLSDITTTAQESYSGIRVIKSFAQESHMLEHFNERSAGYRKSSINLALTEAIYFPAMNLFIGLSILCTIMIGGYLAIQGRITAGNIAEFVIYINLLMFPISSIGWVASMTQRAAVSQQRIDEFLHTKPQIVSPERPVQSQIQGEVVFSDLSFTYPHTGIQALRDFDLHIRKGEKVAIIGKTGSGKSTIAHLLLRMYDAPPGMLKIDGHNIQDYALGDLRRGIAYAAQENYLFSDTIYNNIRFGRPEASDDEVKNAAYLADLDNDIAHFTKGYETVIGERGVMLSGGQKQRLVLARALLKESNLVVLDECLSAVDTRTEQRILARLEPHLAGKTTIVITHRIFSSWEFDQIIVLDDGRIAEQGKHAGLMELNGRYARLYRHQTDKTT